MIKNIRISNFKRIADTGIELDELASVNYLVGENGCGKSSILEALQYFYIYSPRNNIINSGDGEICETLKIGNENNELNQTNSSIKKTKLFQTIENRSANLHLSAGRKMFRPKGQISLCTDFNDNEHSLENLAFRPILIRCDSDESSGTKYQEYYNYVAPLAQKHQPFELFLSFLSNIVELKREINLSELFFILNNVDLNHLVKNDFSQENKFKKLLKFLRHILREKEIILNTNELESGGKDLITKLALSIFYLVNQFQIDLFLIEEPENNLHPNWQKLIPTLFSYLAQEFNIQFIITTHSPFIISSSSQLAQDTKEKSDFNHENFVPPQKVYFLKDGSIASKRGEIELDNSNRLKGRFGYWGNKLVYISSKMLGAGLMDLISPQLSVNSFDAPTVVFCEGEGNDEDARLYNIIFRDLNPPVLFISARGSTQLLRTFQIIKEIKKGLAANFKVKMLRDRDHEFATQADIDAYQNKNPGQRVLLRRAIECYLFNSESAELWLKKYNKKIDYDLLNELDVLNAKIQSEAEHKIMGSDYKTRLKDLFLFIIYGYENPDFVLDQDFKEEICALFSPNSRTYKELYSVIFD